MTQEKILRVDNAKKRKKSTMRCGRKNKKKLTDISDGISRGKLR